MSHATNNPQNSLAFIGREYAPIWDAKRKKIVKYRLDPSKALFLDYSKKQHTFVVAKSGGGKSYLAGVIAEELIRTAHGYSVLIIDPMGVFSTLNIPNTTDEIRTWNASLPRNDLIAQGLGDQYQIWIPEGDKTLFEKGAYDHTFSLRAADLSYETLCNTFDMDVLDPQVNLYRKMQKKMKSIDRDYSLEQLIALILEQKDTLYFKSQTIDALISKLEALEELGIVSSSGVALSDIIQESKVIVFDLSASPTYAARVLVNFLAEQILLLRKRLMRLLTKAKIKNQRLPRPEWYVPPVQILIDEAHNFLPKNRILRKVIKEGRNCGLILTAISQSPDLTRDVYANITHLFVGPLIFDDDINAVRGLLPIEKKPAEFRKLVKSLTVGCFLYYNLDEKQERKIRIRPRRTLHPASTKLEDEHRFLIDLASKNTSDYPVLRFAERFSKLTAERFSTIRLKKNWEIGQVVQVNIVNDSLGLAKLIYKIPKRLSEIPDEFLLKDTDTRTRAEAISLLKRYYPHLRKDTTVMIYYFQKMPEVQGK